MTKHHVHRIERDTVLTYANEVAHVLGLPRWKFLLMEDPADEEATAEVHAVDARRVAQVYLSDRWMTIDDDERRNTVTHEVLHLLHLHGLNGVIYDLEPLLRADEFDQLRRAYRREMELLVDHLAMFMSDTFRLEESWNNARKVSTEAYHKRKARKKK